MKRGLVVAGAVVVGGVVLAVAASAVFKKGKSQIDVSLDMVGSNCVATIKDVLGEKKNGKVKWKVTNNCSSARYIRFENFRRRHFFDSNLDPADPNTVNPSAPFGTIPANSRADVDATIDRDPVAIWPFFDTAKYDVYLGADASSGSVVLDPDVEIWP
jgi:hypothetical protein